MSTSYPDTDIFESDLSDIGDLPLNAEVTIDGIKYDHIMLRTGIVAGESGTQVSAFNSSI
jgi:hypothetical protein